MELVFQSLIMDMPSWFLFSRLIVILEFMQHLEDRAILTNSNSSFGNFGLVAVGLGSTEFTGKVNEDTTAEVDTIVVKEVYDATGLARRPYDGQSLWFKINLDNYPDAVGSGVISAPLQELSSDYSFEWWIWI
jgi:hypothetical protein